MNSERTESCTTNTQYKVMLSGYQWAMDEIIKDINNCIILDAACGMGYGSFCLAQQAKKVMGIDISPKVIRFCKKRYKRDNLDFFRMDCTDLKFNDHTFDVVISQDTIEHIKDDARFLSEVKRILRPKGLFIVFTPHSQEHNLAPGNIYHVREYSKESFQELITQYFPKVEFYGRRLSPELEKLESDLNKIRKYDRWGLRKIIPRNIRHWLGNLIAKLNNDISLDNVSCSHVEYFHGVESSPTIIGVCSNG